MSPSVPPIPSDYPRVTPALYVNGAAKAIEFYQQVLGANQRLRIDDPSGRVGHAELTIGDSVIMLSDEYPDMNILGPRSVGGTSVSLNVYVEDADATYDRALAAGATSIRPMADQFYGDRSGQFEDPFGHRWSVATHIEDVAPDELARRAAAAMGGG